MVDGINFQASLNNLTQLDRLQQDSHHTPIVNQEQNAQAAKDAAAKRIDMPMQPDQAEEKTIDANARKNDQRRQKKKKNAAKTQSVNRGNDTGRFIDFNA